VSLEPYDLDLLRLAIRLAAEARALGADSFGAVLALKGVVVHSDRDRSVERSDPTAHAELAVLSDYCRRAQRFDLTGYTLYASAEPCAMCAGALHWARVSRVIYSVSQAMLQSASGGKPKPSCVTILQQSQRPVEVLGPLLAEEGWAVFEGYVWAPKRARHQQLFPDTYRATPEEEAHG
jgi:tRNA(Arg) A34 adenosine deaminase TadA